MNKISVIVPVYNGQDTIERCIRSIISQKHNELEIIIINDGSTDDTLHILEELEKIDGRIKVKTIENRGVSHARNVALNIATGDYITFVDADDYIDKEMYGSLLKVMNEYKVKIVHCSYTNVCQTGKEVPVGNTGKIMHQTHDEALTCLITGRIFAGGIWNKLYSKDLFDSIRFDETISFNEDVLLNFHLFDKVEESVYIDKAYYRYVTNDNSATHTISSVVSRENVAMVSRIIEKESKGKSYYEYAKKKLAYTLLDLYRAYLLNKEKSQKKKDLKRELKEYKLIYKSKNEKLTYYLAMYFPHICTLTYRIYDKFRVKKLDPIQ